MKRKLSLAAAAILLPAGTVAVLASPASAAPAAPGPAAPGPAAPGPAAVSAAAGSGAASPEMFAALQRDLKLSADQVRVRLSREGKASRVQAELRAKLGASYGGAWLSADAATLTVAVTDAGKAATVRTNGAVPAVVSRSEAALDGFAAKLDANLAKAPKTVPGWYVDVTTNSVVVLSRSGALAAAKAFVAASGVPAGAVRVVASAESPRPFYDVIGGDPYYIGGSSRCSIGFSVSGGFVTAGHCGSNGSTTSGYNQVSQGTFRGSSFPGNDYAWVQVNSNWTPTPYVDNYSGGTVTVNGSTEAAVNASICRSGSTTGWHCGTIQAKNQTVNYSQGSVSGLTRTNVCAEPGDSGGSWLSGQQAQGVTSGGSGNCSSGGTTYFQPVNEILSAYGLTLTTSGGGNPPPPPPPTGCSGYEATYTGTLSGTGDSEVEPNGTYYQSTVSGTHRACLDGPSGVDFDLYLYRWNGSAWAAVAGSESSGPDESISYNGSAGYYLYEVYAYRGSGSFTLAITTP
jgi:streptogrisin C